MNKKAITVDMNISRLYSVYDSVAECFGPVEIAPTDGVALRKFQESMSKIPEHIKSDYHLFFVGNFNKVDGMIQPLIDPVELTPSNVSVNDMPEVD